MKLHTVRPEAKAGCTVIGMLLGVTEETDVLPSGKG